MEFAVSACPVRSGATMGSSRLCVYTPRSANEPPPPQRHDQ